MPLRFCRVCSSTSLSPLWVDFGGNQWHRCAACGCDSSEGKYRYSLYGKQFLDKSLVDNGGFNAAKDALISNIEWFNDHSLKGQTCFLDVGCLEGAGLSVAQDLGWSVHGYDIDESSAQPGCTTIYPFFAANLFPQLYHAIHCREVIEHVPGWRMLLAEMTAVLARDGMLQIQTPRPGDSNNQHTYQPAHLQIFSRQSLESVFPAYGYRVLDYRDWSYGHTWMLRLVDKP